MKPPPATEVAGGASFAGACGADGSDAGQRYCDAREIVLPSTPLPSVAVSNEATGVSHQTLVIAGAFLCAAAEFPVVGVLVFPPIMEAQMRRIHSLILVSLVLVVTASAAAAQACMGMASFAAGPVRLGGGASVTGDADTYGATAAYGRRQLFGQLGIGRVSYDNFDESSTLVGGGLGYQIALKSRRPVQICPSVSVSHGFGPDNLGGSGVDMSSTNFTFGAQMGTPIRHSKSLTIVPTMGLSFANTSVTFDDAGGSVSSSESYGIFGLGAGFVINSVYTIHPEVSFPLGLEGSDPSFGLSVSVNLRGSSSAPKARPGRPARKR